MQRNEELDSHGRPELGRGGAGYTDENPRGNFYGMVEIWKGSDESHKSFFVI